MRSVRPRRGLPLLVAVTLMLAVGCSTGQRAADAARAEKPDLTVSVVPAVDSAGFFVALYRGLFPEQGLNVRFVPAVSSETVIADQVAVMSLESYPVSSGPVGSVDRVRLQRVVDVMHQFIAFPQFDIDSMLMGG